MYYLQRSWILGYDVFLWKYWGPVHLPEQQFIGRKKSGHYIFQKYRILTILERHHRLQSFHFYQGGHGILIESNEHWRSHQVLFQQRAPPFRTTCEQSCLPGPRSTWRASPAGSTALETSSSAPRSDPVTAKMAKLATKWSKSAWLA